MLCDAQRCYCSVISKVKTTFFIDSAQNPEKLLEKMKKERENDLLENNESRDCDVDAMTSLTAEDAHFNPTMR